MSTDDSCEKSKVSRLRLALDATARRDNHGWNGRRTVHDADPRYVQSHEGAVNHIFVILIIGAARGGDTPPSVAPSKSNGRRRGTGGARSDRRGLGHRHTRGGSPSNTGATSDGDQRRPGARAGTRDSPVAARRSFSGDAPRTDPNGGSAEAQSAQLRQVSRQVAQVHEVAPPSANSRQGVTVVTEDGTPEPTPTPPTTRSLLQLSE